jgi:hypothetical protein
LRRGAEDEGDSDAGLRLSIISNEAVQKDLALNEEQTKKITALNEELNAERGKMFAELQASTEDLKSLPENEQREKRMAAMMESNKLNTSSLRDSRGILEPKQQDRLKQISWQAAGTAAYRSKSSGARHLEGTGRKALRNRQRTR